MKVQKPVARLVVVSAFLLASLVQAQPQPQQPEGDAAAKAEVQALRRQAQQLRSEGRLEAAIDTTQKMLAKERTLYGQPNAELAVSLEFLAELHEATQNFAAAETSLQEVLTIRMQVFGERDRRTIDARLALEDSQIRQKISPEQRQQLADAKRLHVDARQAYDEGNVRKALALEMQVRKVRRESLGRNHPDVAVTYANIAFLFSKANAWEGAALNYREAVRIRRQQMGTSHPEYFKTLDALAGALRLSAEQSLENEQFAEAVVGFAEALAIRASRHGTDDWRTRELRVDVIHAVRLAALTPTQRKELEHATEVNQAAVQLYGEKKYEQAAEKIDEALTIRRKLLGAKDPDTLLGVQNSAIAAGDLGQDAKAEKLFREVTNARWSLFGGGHKATRDSIGRLANHLEHVAQQQLESEQFDQAIGKRREVVHLKTIVLGQNDWRVVDARRGLEHAKILAGLTDEQRRQLKTADQLHQTYRSLEADGRFSEAIVPCQQALEIREAILGELHPETATSLNNLAALNYSQGNYAKAEPLYRRSIEIWKKVMGDLHPKTASSLSNLGALYKLQGDYAKAEPLYLQSLEIKKKVLGNDHPDTALGLNNLAALYYSQGAYAQAEPLFQKSLEIRKKVLGEDHPDTAQSLNNLALLYESQGDYAKAEPLYRQSLEIDRKALGENHPVFATDLNNLAAMYYSQGDYAKAEPLLRQGLEIRKKVLGQQHPDTAQSLNNLAALYRSQGDYAKAEPLMQQSLEINRKAFGENHPVFATDLNNLAELYRSQGDFAKAEPLYRQSLEIYRKVLGNEHTDVAMSLNNLALLYMSMGDYPRAAPLLQQSLEILKKVMGDQHPNTASSMNNLAYLYRVQGDYAKAEPLYRESLAIRKTVLGEQHPSTAVSLDNLSVLYGSQGDYARAEPLCKRSLDIHKSLLGEDHPDTAICLNNLAWLYESQGDYAKAEPLYRQSLKITKEILSEQHPSTATSLNNLARLYYWQGDYVKAEPLIRRALSVTRASLEATALIQSERQQLTMAQGLRRNLDTYLSLATISEEHREQAFREVLAWKGATLVRQRQMRKVAQNSDVAPLFKELQQTTTRLATLSRMVPEPQRLMAWRRQITELTAEKEKLEADLSQKSSEFREATKQVTLEDMLAALPKDAALVDFLEYRRLNPHADGDDNPRLVHSLLAFVVRDGEPVVTLDLGPAAPVSEAIDIWRRTFGTARDGVAAGRLLREKIWEPVEEHLDGSQLVLVSADGALGRLPIAALPGKKDATYLLEDYRLAMLPVPQLLPALVSELGRKELSGGLLLMGDVDYDADPKTESDQPPRKSWKRSSTAMTRGAGLHFSHLDATAGEIATIKEVFTDLFQPGSEEIKTLKQMEATEQQFREVASKFYNLHLATHGFFADPGKKSALDGDDRDRERLTIDMDREQRIRGFNPGLLSGLAFSGANRKPEADKDDGILTADEIASLSLDGVDLVVLSACETGLGEVAGGEGLLGVQRAFQVAGARSTVASLWQVGDVATRRLMERFYRNYWEKEMSKLDSLREAQLWLLNHPEEIRGVDRRIRPEDNERPKRLSPQFWAAFSLSGDWR